MQMQACTPCCESPPSGWQVTFTLAVLFRQSSLSRKAYPQIYVVLAFALCLCFDNGKRSSEQAAQGLSYHEQTSVRGDT